MSDQPKSRPLLDSLAALGLAFLVIALLASVAYLTFATADEPAKRSIDTSSIRADLSGHDAAILAGLMVYPRFFKDMDAETRRVYLENSRAAKP